MKTDIALVDGRSAESGGGAKGGKAPGGRELVLQTGHIHPDEVIRFSCRHDNVVRLE